MSTRGLAQIVGDSFRSKSVAGLVPMPGSPVRFAKSIDKNLMLFREAG
jgi:hypothetical protein